MGNDDDALDDDGLAVVEKLSRAGNDWEALDEAEQELAALWKLEADMFNGGFLQFKYLASAKYLNNQYYSGAKRPNSSATTACLVCATPCEASPGLAPRGHISSWKERMAESPVSRMTPACRACGISRRSCPTTNAKSWPCLIAFIARPAKSRSASEPTFHPGSTR